MFCKKCQQQGQQVLALRVQNGVGMCETHYREFVDGPAAEPQAQQKENEAMPPKKDINWEEIQKKRDAGVSAKAICKEYGISSGLFYTKTKSAKKTASAKKNKPLSVKRATAVMVAFDRSVNAHYQEVLADLIARRDELNQAIETIRNLK